MNKTPSRTRLMSNHSTSSTDSGCSLDDKIGAFDHQETFLPEREGRPSTRNASTRRLAVASLVSSIVFFVVLFACGCCYIISDIASTRETLAKASCAYEPVCVPCIQINGDPLRGTEESMTAIRPLDFHVSADGDSLECCAKTPAQYAMLFKLILKRQESVKKLADILGPSGGDKPPDDVTNGGSDPPFSAPPARAGHVVSAHLLLDSKAPRSHNDTHLAWKSPSRSPLSHVRSGLVYHNNTMYVKTEGLYFVYCQILYGPHGAADTHQIPTLSSSYVIRDSVAYPAFAGILLKARHTRNGQGEDRHSTFEAGLFFLHVGDTLHVRATHAHLVAHDEKGSFFGLYKVD